ncbi:chromate transporter [Gudongella sp. DL1XJH-153]|uniref:chromate transporter n=1 Tax=Gudongella sp. DL1XJH-153 TaxID=3409804 RepID=UPI003BB7DAB9
MTLLQLFISFIKIGAFSFGGGYAMLPLIEEEVVEVHGWITTPEYIDILAIAEMTPGPIAINSATFLGYKVAGFVGSAVATIGVVLPSFIIMSLIFVFVQRFKKSPYVNWIFKGIRPVVLGLIASAAVSVGGNTFVDLKSVLIAILLFVLVAFRDFNPIFGIILAGALGAILF